MFFKLLEYGFGFFALYFEGFSTIIKSGSHFFYLFSINH